MAEQALSFDAGTNTVSVAFPGTALETAADIDQHFKRVFEFWRTRCGGRKVYWLVDYDGFTVNIRENELYGTHMKRLVEETALAVVRYGGSNLQRTAVRLYNMRMHASSNLYADRAAALVVLRKLRAGEIEHAIGR